MANAKNVTLLDHNYDMLALQEACDEDTIEEMEIQKGITNEHTPLPSPNPKKIKKKDTKEKEMEVSNKSIFESCSSSSHEI